MKQVSTFANRLKEYMNSHNRMTYDVLSKLTGENPQTLNRYALGQRVPKIDSAVNIALKLGVSPMWLQGFDEPELYCSTTKFSNGLHSSADDSLLSDFHKLNHKGKEAAQATIKGMTCVQEYTQSDAEDAG